MKSRVLADRSSSGSSLGREAEGPNWRRSSFPALGLVGAVLAAAGLSPAWAGGGVSLLKDLYSGPAVTRSSAASDFAPLGAGVIFRACDSEHGCELWKSDGTALGTVIVADLWKGEGSGNPTAFVASGSKVFFLASDGIHGTKLWVTDGTSSGTQKLLQGTHGFYGQTAVPLNLGAQVLSGTDDLVVVSNATLAVTVLLAGVIPDSAAAIGSTAYFSARPPNATTSASSLYRTDGTIAGTQVVTAITNSIGGVFNLTAVNSSVFFPALTIPGNGRELWVSDGTAGGTMEVKDIRPGSSSSSPSLLTPVSSTLYFTANDGTNGVELWKSDGTSIGTTLVRDINPGSASSSPSDLVAIGSTLYFVATDGATGREVWKSDGTPAGTVPVADLVLGASSSSPSRLLALGSNLVFFANDGVHGMEPWISDGTGLGTTMISDFNPGSANGVDATLVPKVVGGMLYLAIDTGASGLDPWTSDGTAGGTSILADLATGEGDGRLPSFESPFAKLTSGSEVISLTNVAVFPGFEPATGWELWRTDGTPAGTALLSDIRLGSESSFPWRLTRVGNRVFFFANDGVNGQELWVTDGTGVGTVLVADLAVGDLGLYAEYQQPSTFFRGSGPIALNSQLVFAADAGGGNRLWRSDGSAPGTVDLASAANVNRTGLAILKGRVQFVDSDGLWQTDGTAGGTGLLVANGAVGFGGEGPMISSGQRLYLDGVANFGSGEVLALVTTDGTVEGSTGLVGPADTEYRTAVGNKLVFAHRDATHGYEPWVTDSTVGGTSLLVDVLPGLASSAPQSFTQLGGVLYFAADDGTHGVELWKTDGTGPGTQLFLDIAPGAAGSYPRCLTELGGILYFAAYRPAEGSELWRTDGTVLGTELVADAAPGNGSSSPCGFARVGNKVVFTAWDEPFGRELRVIDDVGRALLHAAFEDGTFGEWSLFTH